MARNKAVPAPGIWARPAITRCSCCGQVEWRPGELYPGVGFIVTNLGRRAERVVAFYNQRGTAHARYVTRQMAEVAVSRQMFADIPSSISGCGHRPPGIGLVRA